MKDAQMVNPIDVGKICWMQIFLGSIQYLTRLLK